MKEIIEKIISDPDIKELITLHDMGKDMILFDEGDNSYSIFFILSGSVIIEKSINKEKTQFKELAYINAPSFIGEIALFENIKRTARAKTLENSRLIEISKENFYKIIEIKPALANEMLLAISKTLAMRIAHTSRELTLLYDISKELANYYSDEKEFLKKITDEISIYFSDCEIETYYYNFFNDEFEKIYELNANLNPEINLKDHSSSMWLDNKTYISVIKNEEKTAAIILFFFKNTLTPQEINDYTTIFNTISYIVSSGLKETARNKEMLLIERLKRTKKSI